MKWPWVSRRRLAEAECRAVNVESQLAHYVSLYRQTHADVVPLRELSASLLSSDLAKPERIAEVFAGWVDDKQARFINAVAVETETWKAPAIFQWTHLRGKLTPAGEKLLVDLTEHALREDGQ